MGNRPISVIGTAWDNTNRNAMEQNRKDTKQGLDELAAKDTQQDSAISTAQTTANNAMSKANEAKTKADSVQNQVDDLVIESGNSNAEVVQMRTDLNGNTYTTAKERVDIIEVLMGKVNELITGDSSVIESVNKLHYFVSPEEKRFNGNVQAAINATPAYGTVYLDAKKSYVFDSINIDKPIFFEGNNALITPTAINKSVFLPKGTRSTVTYTLSQNLKRGDRFLTLKETPTDLAIGDLILLTDDLVRADDSTPETNSEVHEIESIDSVNKKIKIRDFVRLPKTASSNVNLYKFTPVEDVVFRNVNIQLVEGSANGHGIYAQYVRNIKTYNFKMRRGAQHAIWYNFAYRCLVDGFDVRNPQTVAVGKGYGMRAEKALGITFKNGYGHAMRHTIDFHNAFDCLVEDVIAVGNTSTSFFISHNGMDSDITLRDCRALNCQGVYGFGIHNQAVVNENTGLGDPYSIAFYGLTMDNCYAQMEDAAYFYGFRCLIPLKESLINRFRTVCGSGFQESTNQNAGIQLTGLENDVTISNSRFQGFMQAFYIYYPPNDQTLTQVDKSARVKLLNNKFINTKYGVLSNYGSGKYLFVDGLECNNVSTEVFRCGSAKYRELTIKNVSLMNCPDTVKIFQNIAIADTNGAYGEINHIFNDKITKTPLTITASKQLTSEEFYFNQQDKYLFFTSDSAVTMGSNALPDGITEGQKVCILNVGSNNITIILTSKLVTSSGANSVIGARQKLNLVWFNGAWREV